MQHNPFVCVHNAILVSYGAITNYHRLSGLRQLLSYSSGGQISEMGINGLKLRCRQLCGQSLCSSLPI